MVWFVDGNRVNTVLGVSDSGTPICHGQGRHEPKPAGGDTNHDLLRQLQRVSCSWTIALPSEDALHIDGGGEGLVDRVKDAPHKSHGMIKYFADAPSLLGIVTVVPEPTFTHIRRLLELVLLSDSLHYMFTVDFLGFRVPHAQTETPTWREFMDGKPYFFEKITVAVKANTDDA